MDAAGSVYSTVTRASAIPVVSESVSATLHGADDDNSCSADVALLVHLAAADVTSVTRSVVTRYTRTVRSTRSPSSTAVFTTSRLSATAYTPRTRSWSTSTNPPSSWLPRRSSTRIGRSEPVLTNISGLGSESDVSVPEMPPTYLAGDALTRNRMSMTWMFP